MVEAALLYLTWAVAIIVILIMAVGISYLLLKNRIYDLERDVKVEVNQT